MYYFNFGELKYLANSNILRILYLTYAAFKGYNNLIALNIYELNNQLKIPNADIRYFKYSEYFYYEGKNKRIISKYQCNDPQTYFTNGSFLTAVATPKEKIEYLYLLSQRAPTDLNNYIPQKIVNTKLYTNPFVKVSQDKLVFLLEHSNKGEHI